MHNSFMKYPLVENKKISVIIGSILVLFFSILYSGYLKNDSILSRDDKELVVPMKDIKSIGDYIEKVSSNKILDVQPVRDFSYWINAKLYDLVGYPGFHLINLILFFLCIYLVYRILTLLNFNPTIIIMGSLIFALHPIMVSSVGWISARKHSLALVFILCAIIDLLKKEKLTWKLLLFYLLSVFSHQIVVLFPIWVIYYTKLKKITLNKKILVALLLVGSSSLFIRTSHSLIISLATYFL